MNIVDYIILGVLIIGAINGYRKGLLSSITGIASCIIGLVVAYKYRAGVVSWLEIKFQAAEKLSHFFRSYLILPEPVMQFSLNNIRIPDIGTYLDGYGIMQPVREQVLLYLNKLQEGLSIYGAQTLGDVLYRYLAAAVVSAAVFLIIWFLVHSFGLVLAGFLTWWAKDTALGSVNRLCGMLVGVVLTGLIITVLTGLVTPLLGMADLAEPSLFSAVIKTMGEAQTIPYFTSLFEFLTDKVTGMLLF